MQDSLTIKKFPKYSDTTDYTGLVNDFIQECQKYSGNIWTDYNIHDPGVTMIELLSLAITELGLKSELDIFNIIFYANRLTFNPEEYALYGALDVFPTMPVTINDYRRTIIDTFINEVDNIWLQPASFTKDGSSYKGLIDIFVKAKPDAHTGDLAKRITSHYLSVKNIGEDLHEVTIMKPVSISIRLTASVRSHSLPEEIYAELRQVINKEIEKPVEFESYLSCIREGIPVEEVLTGPLLENGSITDLSLENSDIRNIKTLHKSKIILTIINSDLIESIESIEIYLNERLVKDDFIEIKENEYPVFDHERSVFNLYKDRNLLSVNKETQDYIFRSAYIQKKVFSKKSLEDYLAPKLYSNISLKEINYLYSIQDQFPRIYGISSYGAISSKNRHLASRQQLKGYLSLFEQIMQNFLCQLSNIDKLYSVFKTEDATYFTSYPENIPGFETVTKLSKKSHTRRLEQISDRYDRKYDRRNIFINHICARFGEEFPPYLFSEEAGNETSLPHQKSIKEVRLKANYLKKFSMLSANRTKSSLPGKNERKEQSSFHVKLMTLLGIEHQEERDVSSFSKSIEDTPGRNLKISIKNNADLQSLFRDIIRNDNYTIERERSGFCLFFNSQGKKHRIMTSKEYAGCEKEKDSIMEKGKKMNEYCEYFHILENIQLRPKKEGLSTTDPYSNIITIILPDWPAKFQQPAFRKNLNNLVELHAPVHIRCDIKYLTLSGMSHFEKLFNEFRKKAKAHEDVKKNIISMLGNNAGLPQDTDS